MLCIHSGPFLSVYDEDAGVMRSFPPKWMLPEHTSPIRQCGAKRYRTLMEYVEKHRPRSVCCYRTFALGDVMMLIPVLRLFHRIAKLGRPILLVTSHGLADALGSLTGDPSLRIGKALGKRDYGADVHIDLDFCLEVDHRGGPESNLHRVDLYAEVLGL